MKRIPTLLFSGPAASLRLFPKTVHLTAVFNQSRYGYLPSDVPQLPTCGGHGNALSFRPSPMAIGACRTKDP